MEDNVREVNLQKSDTFGFGFSIIGGAGSDLPPVIFDIVENSPAHCCGQLETGDAIVAVNGEEVASFSTKQVVKCLQLCGSTLHLTLQKDPVIKRYTQRYLNCSSGDLDSLRDAISPSDLKGVGELIVRHPSSPTPSPKSSPKKIPRNINDQHPATGADKRLRASGMEAEGVSGQYEPAGTAPGTSAADLYDMKPCQENGLDMGKKSSANMASHGTPPTNKRKFETFVMTGDMIIRTSAPPTKSETRDKAASASADSSKSNKAQSGMSPRKVPDSPQKSSRIPMPKSAGSPRASPKASPKPASKRDKNAINESEACKAAAVHSGQGDGIQGEEPVAAGPASATTVHPVPAPVPTLASQSTRHSPRQSPRHIPRPIVNAPLILDIPPDDISSEDEKFKLDGVVDLDELPPPPDELLEDITKLDEPPPPPVVPVFNYVPLTNDTTSYPVYNGAVSQVEYPPPVVPPPTQNLPIVAASVPPPHNFTQEAVTTSPVEQVDQAVVHLDNGNIGETAEAVGDTPPPGMVTSQSAEKISSNNKSSVGVRTSKSHENYLEHNREGVTLVNIDFDVDEKISSSVDALHYEKSNTSLDSLGNVANAQFMEQSRSLDNSPERRYEKQTEKVFMPTFISLEEPKKTGKTKEAKASKLPRRTSDDSNVVKNPAVVVPQNSAPAEGQVSVENKESQKRDDQGVQSQPKVQVAMVTNSDTVVNGDSHGNPSDSPPAQVENAPNNAQEVMQYKEAGPESNSAQQTVSCSVNEATRSAEPLQGPHSHQGAIHKTDKAKNVQKQTKLPVHRPHTKLQRSATPPEDETKVLPASSNQPSPGLVQTSPSKSKPVSSSPVRLKAAAASSPSHQARAIAEGASETSKLSPKRSPPQSGPPSPENGESDADSIYHQPMKEPDKPSAARLAKRLYHLEGFKKEDVTKHLSKKNEFAQQVGEEYLKYYSFTDESLDIALRKFLHNIILAGETQERERVLLHFSKRFMECNNTSFNSEDSCHTLTCALMLLNTDLHGQNIGRKMTVGEFIENLADLNDGENYPKEVLKNLYHAIRAEPLECEFESSVGEFGDGPRGVPGDSSRYLGFNPFLEVPDSSKTTEFKKGFVMRKCCVDPDGRRTPMGRRGWKMFFATLRDMVLYLHKDEHGLKKSGVYDNMSNAIRVHHALAVRATDYKKKQHVLRLQTADWAQYLFQTSDSKECQEWIEKINFAAANLSAPPLPGGVGSQKKFQKPLMPSSYTKLNMREQLTHHEQRVVQLEQELNDHRRFPPEKGAKSRVIQEYCEKEAYLQYELKRFKTYSFLLQAKMAPYPELEPSLVEGRPTPQ